MDATIPTASDRKPTMTAHASRRAASLAAALAAALLAACGEQAPEPAAAARSARGAHASLTGDPACAGPGVHDVHVALFRCDTCHPSGATFGFDRPFTFAGGTTTAGGTIAADAGGLTCTVACHFPKGSPPAPVSWSAAGPLACTSCHAPAALPEPHPPVAGSASRADCEACHVTGDHLAGRVAIRGHGPEWMAPASGGFHAAAANESLASCRGCHGPDLAGSAGAGCGTCHDVALPAGVASWKVNCVMCHGGVELASGAPPRATFGNGGDATRVGAHTKHLTAGALAPAAACSDCHPVPADVFAAGHVDGGTAEVVFGRALEGKIQVWDRATATCTNTYCHSGVGGGTRPAPVWTRLGEGEAACGACHALPPPAPHPSAPGGLVGCFECHPATMRDDGVVIPPAEGGLHLDGSVQASGHPDTFKDPASPDFHAYAANRGLSSCQPCHGPALDGVGGSTRVSCSTAACHGEGFVARCTACHGGEANATGAPPRTTWGNASDPLRVGAHTRHVIGGTISRPIACAACHAVPADAFAPGHVDGGLAEVAMGGLASAGGATPRWDRAPGSCSSVYCHGATLASAGTHETPSWTGGAGGTTCGACHFDPAAPTGLHLTHRFACGGGNGQCHPAGYTTTSVNVELHVDGTLQASGVCEACHYD